MKKLYTIGYSCFKLLDMIKILKSYNINSLIDVRSNPHSKFYEDYNKENLGIILKQNKIHYRNYIKQFGARQEELKYYTDGYLDFDKFTKSNAFLDGMSNIEKGIEQNYSFVIMCAEKDPSTCHRNIMIAKEFFRKGYDVCNILADGSIESQYSLEKRLLNKYFPDRNQLSLFGNDLTEDEMISECYRLRNKEIGFKYEDLKKGFEDLYE